MQESDDPTEPAELVQRLARSTNEHDLEALVACFAPGYRNETPAHPSRGFVGRDQVRRNWEQIFAFVPDLSAELLTFAVSGDTVWSEWEHRGTRCDGSPHLMRGVVILRVSDSMATHARFYLEPVDDDADIDTAVRRHVGADSSASQ
jgi:ketosteroid isomerase-like protein